MRKTTLAATALVVTVITVVLLTAMALNVNAVSKSTPGSGSTSILGPEGMNSAVLTTSSTSATSFGVFAANILLVVGAVGGLWFGVSRGVSYLGQGGSQVSPSLDSSPQAPVDTAVSSGLPFGISVNEKPDEQEQNPPSYGIEQSAPVTLAMTVEPVVDSVPSTPEKLGAWKAVRAEARASRRKKRTGEPAQVHTKAKPKASRKLEHAGHVEQGTGSEPKRNHKTKEAAWKAERRAYRYVGKLSVPR